MNFIVDQDLPETFESLEKASLMSTVHQKLEAWINDPIGGTSNPSPALGEGGLGNQS
ncbi:MAG: hypothetical protein HC920_20635 [Oscillatoriales cyanobacterium SM2_3_0]|nr:hypothetical protein [Oscillatoriales cyanobacterium SM2_3_0]